MIELQRASLDAYSHTRDLCVEVLNKGGLIDPEFSNFAHALLHYYSDRIQSLSLLNQNGRLWDAEIVYRSALECSTRLIYVCIADEAEKKVRVKEFFHDLQEVEYLERTNKAEAAVTNSDKEQTRTLVGGVVLSKEKELKLREKWPKKARKLLKQKWSFAEMVRERTYYNNKSLDLTKYSSLELQELIKSHTSKMLTEPVSMLVICLKAISVSLGVEFDTKPLEKKLAKMHKLGDKLHDSFYLTQSHRYEE